MAAEEVKPDKGAAAPAETELDATPPNPEAELKGASEKGIAEVQQTQQQLQQERTFQGCVAQAGTDLPKDGNVLDALNSSRLDEKLGGDCAAIDTVANLHKGTTPATDGQQVKVEIRPDGTRVETRFENDKLATRIETNRDGSTVESKFGPDGRLVSERSVRGDSATLRMFDESGNVTTLTESGEGKDKVQVWTFPDGDNLRIEANGTFRGTINGKAIEGKGKAEIAAFIRQALTDQDFVPDTSRDSFATDLYGSSMITSSDTRTGAVISKSGDLNIFTPDESGTPQRNIATFSGDTMTLHGPNGAVSEVKGQLGADGKYTFVHNGITYTVENNAVQGMRSQKGIVDQIVTKGPNGWQNEAIERPVDESGNPCPENRVVTTFNDKGELQSQIMDGDKPLSTTIITEGARTTYKGDGSDRSPENIIMRATNSSLETPEITRNGNMVYDVTGRFSDQDRSEARVYNGGAPTSLTKSQLLQFASFTSAMSQQISSFESFFKGVQVGANDMMGAIDSKLGQIQAFIGYVNCNVNGSRFVGLLVAANTALIAGNEAMAKAGTCLPDPVATLAGLNNPELAARTPEDVCKSPSLTLVMGKKGYEMAMNNQQPIDEFGNLQLVRTKTTT
ncbi:MAG: hypothetical protein SFY67_03560 [Candidatus Melainabacteria bacterium]|nr:hypothetical protein [Candidatus Melainabacteria bacterium]